VEGQSTGQGASAGSTESGLFEDWTNSRSIASLGSNNGSCSIAFQGWHKFKEAFPPELILKAVQDEQHEIRACIDPFGGSGTTALASQFLGIDSTTVEVNPFLVDVIRAKLAHIDADVLAGALGTVNQWICRPDIDPVKYFGTLPKTFIEPGDGGRWLFDSPVAARLAAILGSIDQVSDPSHRRFFRVVLGGILVQASNVTVNGKGRRYRRHWENRRIRADDVEALFNEHCRAAIADIHRFSTRPNVKSFVIHGDARKFRGKRLHDLAVFSPPYPNSFDYTDVYNIELWMLGYLKSYSDNRALRHSTLSSHVQVQRRFAKPLDGSPTLNATLDAFDDVREDLWSKWIPSMVGAYFSDLVAVIRRLSTVLRPEAPCWMIVGDSRYAGVFVPTARILAELAPSIGWWVADSDAFRSMRSSSQHGGVDELSETLLILRRA
jgi:DNA modification methylase